MIGFGGVSCQFPFRPLEAARPAGGMRTGPGGPPFGPSNLCVVSIPLRFPTFLVVSSLMRPPQVQPTESRASPPEGPAIPG